MFVVTATELWKLLWLMIVGFFPIKDQGFAVNLWNWLGWSWTMLFIHRLFLLFFRASLCIVGLSWEMFLLLPLSTWSSARIECVENSSVNYTWDNLTSSTKETGFGGATPEEEKTPELQVQFANQKPWLVSQGVETKKHTRLNRGLVDLAVTQTR